MPRHITFAFPGQGSQYSGMLNHFSDEFLNIYKDTVSKALDFDLIDLIANGDEKDLNKTSITQPAILLASYLEFKFITENYNIKPDIVCGHSLGEYSALLAAECLAFEDALQLVYKRGLFMERAEKGSMYAILNTDIGIINDCCLRASSATNSIVSPANINSPKQVVISGANNAVELAVNYLKENGAKKCIKLKVAISSHCELMVNAANDLSSLIKNVSFSMPKYELIHNVDSNSAKDIDDLKERMILQLTKPVQWVDTMNYIDKYNGVFIECGPSKVLSGLAKANNIDNIYSTSSSNFVNEIKELI